MAGRGSVRRLLALLAAGCAAVPGEASEETATLLEEIARLRAEVASLKAPEAAATGGTESAGRAGRIPTGGAVPAPGAAARGPASPAGGAGDPASGAPEDRCEAEPLFARLRSALQKLALLEQDPVEASSQIYDAWERDPSLFDACPAGLVTALVYLSIAQERDWKYRLLHKATYLLYSTPGLAEEMAGGRWPMSDRLIRTMYNNSETAGRAPLEFGAPEAQPRGPLPALGQEVSEADELSVQHSGSTATHFGSALFYNFYHQVDSPCACRTRSWCLPHWLRYLTNSSVDIWLAGRDEQKSLFRMDQRGCIRSLGISLKTHHFISAFDVVFVFEINALMHPQCRVLPARRVFLYPTFELSGAQIKNFEALGVSVLPDDQVLKPPNPQMRSLLEQAAADRGRRGQKRGRMLVMPADIRPMKGQTDFLEAVLFEGAERPSAVRRLQGLTVVVAGGCDGNRTYCEEVVALAQRVNSEGLLSVVVADALSDEELAQIYASSIGVLLHSRVDCNPRAVYEGLVADTPFFVTAEARLHPSVAHLGHVGERDRGRLPEALADFVEFCEAGVFEGKPAEFARRGLTEAESYRAVVEWMDRSFVHGRELEQTIRSDDAFSGAAGGLGALLGGGFGAAAGAGAGLFSSAPGGPAGGAARFAGQEPVRR